MTKLAPSILSADFCTLGDDIAQIKTGGADYIHIDVMDGIFVPNISIGIPVVKSVRRYTQMFLDVHLMIDRPHRLRGSVFAMPVRTWSCFTSRRTNRRMCLPRSRT